MSMNSYFIFVSLCLLYKRSFVFQVMSLCIIFSTTCFAQDIDNLRSQDHPPKDNPASHISAMLEKQITDIDLSPKFQDIEIEMDETNFMYNRGNYRRLNLSLGQSNRITSVGETDVFVLSLNSPLVLDSQTLSDPPSTAPSGIQM